MFVVKLDSEIIPSCPVQNTAPPSFTAELSSNTEFLILPSVAPSCQSIAPPLLPAELFTNVESVNVMLLHPFAVRLRKYTAPPLLAA